MENSANSKQDCGCDDGSILAVAMLGIGLGIGKLSKLLTKSATVIKYAGGITLVILGFYFILTV